MSLDDRDVVAVEPHLCSVSVALIVDHAAAVDPESIGANAFLRPDRHPTVAVRLLVEIINRANTAELTLEVGDRTIRSGSIVGAYSDLDANGIIFAAA